MAAAARDRDEGWPRPRAAPGPTLAATATGGRATASAHPGIVRRGAVAGIRRTRDDNTLAGICDRHETRGFDGNLALVGLFRKRRVRHALPADEARNPVGGGCGGRQDGGLGHRGAAAVEGASRTGMLADGTRSGHTGTMHATAIRADAGRPFLSGSRDARAVRPHRRDVRGDRIRAVTPTGEVPDDPHVAGGGLRRRLDRTGQRVGTAQLEVGRGRAEAHPHTRPGGPGPRRTPAASARPVPERADLVPRPRRSDADPPGGTGARVRGAARA